MRRLLARAFRRGTATAVRVLPRGIAARLMHPDPCDYRQIWVDAAGIPYRSAMHERQRAGGSRPLTDQPTVAEVAAVLRGEQARRVLDAGCGWGRLSAGLSPEFEVDGCDVSTDMLRLCPTGMRTLQLDLAIENMAFVRGNNARWDVAFTRDVVGYLLGKPEQVMYALNNLLAVTRGKVHCWERPATCEWLSAIHAGPRLVLHPIAQREE